jgi:23S rRNA pseudouridine955/2504/2580 synthase
MRFMVVILGLAARRVPRWRHNGGLPGIAPLRLSGKKTAPFPVSG